MRKLAIAIVIAPCVAFILSMIAAVVIAVAGEEPLSLMVGVLLLQALVVPLYLFTCRHVLGREVMLDVATVLHKIVKR